MTHSTRSRRSGRAVINDCPGLKYAAREQKELVVVEAIETSEQYGLGFPQELR